MILKASERGGAKQLARHLLASRDNDHVEVHEVRGFLSEELTEALHEAYAVSRGTKCRKFLFSLSLNPPEDESVPVEVFEKTIATIEKKLGLENQPRAIVFHEKEGRRHAHCVWSRIDPHAMKAINLPFFKRDLYAIAKETYLENRWKLPKGFVTGLQKDPATFSREEWQQAKRVNQDARTLKALFQDCWRGSDSRKAFETALKERGFFLARGDRRGYVALDYKGEIYALSRWTDAKPKELKARLGDPKVLPSVNQTKAAIARRMTAAIEAHIRDTESTAQKRLAELSLQKADLVQRQHAQRADIERQQDRRWQDESQQRARRHARGVRAAWEFVSGKYWRIRRQNEAEVLAAGQRDRAERQALVEKQRIERRSLQKRIVTARQAALGELGVLRSDIAAYIAMGADKAPSAKKAFSSTARLHAGKTEQKSRPRTPPGPSFEP
ncbi:MAG: relaxase [Rhodospirillales bacterium]|nr:relaxase [Rhodospirillales bacterium]